MGSSTTSLEAAPILPRVPPGCSQTSTSQHSALSPHRHHAGHGACHPDNRLLSARFLFRSSLALSMPATSAKCSWKKKTAVSAFAISHRGRAAALQNGLG